MEDIEARAALEESGRRKPLDDVDLQGIVSRLIANAVEYIDAEESPVRAQATEYFRGAPFGDEEEGRSQVVTQDVRDTVMLMLPSLMRSFFGSEKAVEFVPRGPEDVALAEQATDYVNYLIVENDGFRQFHAAFQDALLKRVGIIKTIWEEKINETREEYSGLDEQALQALLLDADIESTEVDSYPDPAAPPPRPPPPVPRPDGTMAQPEPPPPPMLHDVIIRRRRTEGRICLTAVPPEEFLIDRRARDLDGADIVAHRRYVTISELAQMGYDPVEMEQHAGTADGELQYNAEAYERNQNAFLMNDERTDEAMRSVLYVEAYIRVDADGTGIAQLYRVCTAGVNYEIVDLKAVAEHPFSVFCPYPEAHRWRGLGVFDLTRDIQNIKSHVLRNMLDSLALSIHPRMAVVEGQANIDDVLNTEMGSLIRMRAPGAVSQMTLPFVGQNAFPVLEYLDDTKEQRTGMNRASMGLDPEAMQSTTAAAVSASVNASQMQIELVARNFAETMKQIFRRVLGLVARHQDRERMVRLSGRFVPMDPRTWDLGMDVSVNVALGAGTFRERMGALQAIVAKHEQVFEKLGENNPVVGIKQYINTLKKVIELAGFQDTERFVGNPDYKPPKPEDKKPSPEEVLARVQVQQIQASMQIESAKLELEQREMLMKDDRERDKMESDMQLKVAELESKYNMNVDVAAIRAAVQRERTAKSDA